ncbi:excinuclease ABC subunit UvrC [Porphyromonas catoniae]|uniref:UvrABC system protein C n=1 Tax=Porphyromonas catoniae ATCC 51270 TaxID=887901 RepID=Z4WNT6_9PORP|nr:excinuclease ABC subunit UvrC [Porphyromonas catoniae]EWC91246.1 excinuclease ABC, C subunit [Porphyromonas catoniae ATCC 51270]
MTIDEIRKILPTLPEAPGCYKYIGQTGEIIYVGKAKNLRRRVSSYFQRDIQSSKTRLLVRQIRGIEYIVVGSEAEALILENALIKEHKPRYNILLKDDKTYPEVVIHREHFPRIRVERRPARDGSQHFGPYPNAGMAHAAVAMVRDLYPIRTCDLDLSPHKIAQGKYKVCLEYHIGKCKAPCVGYQTEEDYDHNIREITSLLRGNLRDVIELYKEEMLRLSGELRFEEAQIYKERLQYLENYQVKHTVAPHHIHNVDVFSFEEDADGSTYVNFMHLTQGMVTQVYTLEYRSLIEGETREELFASAITELRQRFASRARELILPFDPGWRDDVNVTITIPQRGDKKKLLELSERNVRQYKVDKYKRAERLNPDQKLMQVVGDLKQRLSLERVPMHIECFDNSNIQGSDPVAACVVFKRGRPSKKDYRKFNIRSVEGPDDYASMKEVVTRRYRRMVEAQEALPDLILADGGKGQVGAIRDALSSLGVEIPVAGLVKDDRHRTAALLYGEDALREIPVRHHSPTFHLLEQIQAEVHRFAITFHRDKRSKSQLSSRLDYIKGVGAKTKDTLLSTFHSVQGISSATLVDLTRVIGPSKARIVYNAFHPDASEESSVSVE